MAARMRYRRFGDAAGRRGGPRMSGSEFVHFLFILIWDSAHLHFQPLAGHSWLSSTRRATMRRLREREVTFEVEESWRMPDLAEVQPDGAMLDASTDELQAIYFDTPQGTLQRLGVTLRRRTGGADAGWHLKVTEGLARTEYQSRSRGPRVPEALNRL